jgi:hypothetical protein
MQETAKQAGDVISVSEEEKQSAIGFVRWRIQSSLAKLRLRTTKQKSMSVNPRPIPFTGERPLTALYKGFTSRSKEKRSESASRQSTSSERLC